MKIKVILPCKLHELLKRIIVGKDVIRIRWKVNRLPPEGNAKKL
jgi:hypothetical protein